MSKLFDKEVNAQKEFEKNFRGSRKLPHAHEKVCDENETKKKTTCALKCFWWKEALYKARIKNWGKQSKQASSQQFWTQWRYYLFSKQVNWCQGDGFSSVSPRTGAIKLAIAGTQDWWCRFSPLLGY